MSHITVLNIQVKDVEALLQACQTLGLTFNRDKKSYKWYNGTLACDHTISVANDSYEIGLIDRGTHFDLAGDFMGQLRYVAGIKGVKLVQEYSKVVAIKEATRIAENEGYLMDTLEDPDTGETVITLRSYE
jgi:hypothetical protein